MSYDFEKDRTSPTDLCVLCGEDTGIPKETYIDFREFYVEGCGQLCHKCGEGLRE
jgi:hypothetical protein